MSKKELPRESVTVEGRLKELRHIVEREDFKHELFAADVRMLIKMIDTLVRKPLTLEGLGTRELLRDELMNVLVHEHNQLDAAHKRLDELKVDKTNAVGDELSVAARIDLLCAAFVSPTIEQTHDEALLQVKAEWCDAKREFEAQGGSCGGQCYSPRLEAAEATLRQLIEKHTVKTPTRADMDEFAERLGPSGPSDKK